MEGAKHLGIDAHHQLQPMLRAFFVLNTIARFPLPDWLIKFAVIHVYLIRCIGIAETGKQTVRLVFLLQQVKVEAQTVIRGLSLVGDTRYHVFLMVGLAVAQFKDRKPLVMEVQS